MADELRYPPWQHPWLAAVFYCFRREALAAAGAGRVEGFIDVLTIMSRNLPRFLHLLTGIHALGALACFVMAIGSAVSAGFRDALVVSGGSALMVELFGPQTWAFLLFVGAVLAILAYASWRVYSWAWEMTLVLYGIGVLGSLWQVSLGIAEGWLAAFVNGAVVAYAATPTIRNAYHAAQEDP